MSYKTALKNLIMPIIGVWVCNVGAVYVAVMTTWTVAGDYPTYMKVTEVIVTGVMFLLLLFQLVNFAVAVANVCKQSIQPKESE